MALNRPTFRVELADGTEHTVEVIHGDQLRAELEAKKQGIPVDFAEAPVHLTTLWVWSSLVRTGVCQVGFQEFSNTQLVQLVRGKADHPDPVRPTQQGQPTDAG